jgi:hypothetical protein
LAKAKQNGGGLKMVQDFVRKRLLANKVEKMKRKTNRKVEQTSGRKSCVSDCSRNQEREGERERESKNTNGKWEKSRLVGRTHTQKSRQGQVSSGQVRSQVRTSAAN